MSEYPETIWLTHFLKDNYGSKLGRGIISDLDHGTAYPAYRRAALPPATVSVQEAARVFLNEIRRIKFARLSAAMPIDRYFLNMPEDDLRAIAGEKNDEV